MEGNNVTSELADTTVIVRRDLNHGLLHTVVQVRVLWSLIGPEVTDCDVGREVGGEWGADVCEGKVAVGYGRSGCCVWTD